MNPAIIGLATLATIARVFMLLGISVVSGWLLAYGCLKSRKFETIFVPLTNAFESIPVIGFLPIVLVVFVGSIGGGLGVEIAADFLVFDAVAWNIWIGAYQAFKTVPEHLLEVSDNYRFGFLSKMRELYIPHSIPRLSSNLFASFADAFFYISVSEVFSVGIQSASGLVQRSYQVFGIGTLIATFLQQGDFTDVYISLAFIALGVIIATFGFIKFGQWAVARYGVDTTIEIKHGTGGIRRQLSERYRAMSKYASQHVPKAGSHGVDDFAAAPGLSHRERMGRWIAISAAALIGGYLVYSCIRLVLSIGSAQWHSFLVLTPFLLYSMAVDYVRVGVVTLASLGLALTAGYYLAVHHRAAAAIMPGLQAFAAFPAPAYFPLLFIATLPFLVSVLPTLYTEVYIFILGFLSTFYYVFFDFWIGVMGIPSQFWDLMENHELGFLTKMRRVIIPASFPYLVTGLSSTINSAWAGIAIGEYWPKIDGTHNLIAGVGMMKFIGSNLASGSIGAAAWVSFLFAIVVVIYGLFFTRNLMDIARRKYVVEEGVFAA